MKAATEPAFKDPSLIGNERIEEAICLFYQNQTPERFTAIGMVIRERIAHGGHFLFPADITTDEDSNQLFHFKTMDLEIGPALVAFTSETAYKEAPPSGAVSHFIDCVLESLLHMEEIQGLLINPWGDTIYLGKEDIAMILTPGSERFL